MTDIVDRLHDLGDRIDKEAAAEAAEADLKEMNCQMLNLEADITMTKSRAREYALTNKGNK